MCFDPDPDPASHNVNLAGYGCLGGGRGDIYLL